MEEQKALTACIEERQKLTQEFNQRTEKLKQSVEEDQHRYQQTLQAEKVWILIWLSSAKFTPFISSFSNIDSHP